MRKILVLWQIISFFSIILSFPVSCTKDSHQINKISISDNNMSQVTTQVNLNQDIYENDLIYDNKKTGALCFKTLLIQNINQFGKTNHLDLIYATDYNFTIENIDSYAVIKSYGLITIDVEAAKYSQKIIGSFKVQVNLVNAAKSIDNIKIDKQTFNQVEVNKTIFENVIFFYLGLIKSKVEQVDNQAKPFIDYAINFEGYNLKAVITNNDLGIRKVVVNATGDKPNPLLEGGFAFQVELI